MNWLKEFVKEEDGIAVVEVVLVITIFITLIILFRDKIEGIVKNALNSIETGSDKIIK